MSNYVEEQSLDVPTGQFSWFDTNLPSQTVECNIEVGLEWKITLPQAANRVEKTVVKVEEINF